MIIARFIRLFSLLAIFLFSSSCISQKIIGSGNILSEIRSLEDIHEVHLGGIGELFLSQDVKELLVIEAEDNILPFIEISTDKEILSIGIQNDVQHSNALQPTLSIKYYLNMKTIEGMIVSGSTSLHATTLTLNDLALECSGNGWVKIDSLNSNRLSVELSGSGCIEIAGFVSGQEIEISGNSKYLAEDLESSNVSLITSGSTDAIVWANNYLDLDSSGAGEIRYFGRPVIKQMNRGPLQIIGMGNK